MVNPFLKIWLMFLVSHLRLENGGSATTAQRPKLAAPFWSFFFVFSAKLYWEVHERIPCPSVKNSSVFWVLLLKFLEESVVSAMMLSTCYPFSSPHSLSPLFSLLGYINKDSQDGNSFFFFLKRVMSFHFGVGNDSSQKSHAIFQRKSRSLNWKLHATHLQLSCMQLSGNRVRYRVQLNRTRFQNVA